MKDQITAKEYRATKAKKPNKYKNVKHKLYDIDMSEETAQVFDSKREMRKWNELKILEATKEIFDLKRQVKFVLIPAQYWSINGKKYCIERACTYIADFTYNDKEMKLHVLDSKGFRTPDYVIKRKLLLQVHGIRIEEV